MSNHELHELAQETTNGHEWTQINNDYQWQLNDSPDFNRDERQLSDSAANVPPSADFTAIAVFTPLFYLSSTLFAIGLLI